MANSLTNIRTRITSLFTTSYFIQCVWESIPDDICREKVRRFEISKPPEMGVRALSVWGITINSGWIRECDLICDWAVSRSNGYFYL